MPVVVISGWRYGFAKIKHTRLLNALAGMGLKEAHEATHAVLDDKAVSVRMPTQAAAQQLAASLSATGAICTIASEADQSGDVAHSL